jgi:5-methylcytosine-specific restriction protein B
VAFAPTMKILYGPPGTGKTWKAARDAVEIIDGKVDDASVVARHTTLVAQGRIWWVTFHPSYSYEDFVEGFRPEVTDAGAIVYRVVDGPFKLACEATAAGGEIQKGEVLNATGTEFTVIDVNEETVTVRSIVNRDDKTASEKVEVVSRDLIQKLKDAGIEPREVSYSGKNHALRKDVAARAGIAVTQLTSTGPNRAVYQRLLNTDLTPPGPVVLVIDEINRADLSRVFGELLTLLEIDKRQGAAEQRAVFLPYSQDRFSVPAALSIIGTMNTADRSLAVIDLALRRRFEFEEVEPNPLLCSKDFGGINLQALLARWNKVIVALRSREHRIGHSDLLDAALTRVQAKLGKTNDGVDGQRRALAWTIRRKILPLLLEYFHGEWRKAAAVIGPAFFEDVAIPDGLDDLIDSDDSASFALRSWWDPLGEWDGEKFAKAIVAAAASKQA